MSPHRGEGDLLIEVENMPDENIWMLRLNAIAAEHGSREVLQVERYYNVSPSKYCRCKNVPVVRVGEDQARYENLMAYNQAVGHCPVHGIACSWQLVCQVRPLEQQVPDPLIMYLRRPACAKKVPAR